MLLFQNLTEGEGRGEVAVARLDDVTAARRLTGLRCDRVHFAAGRGLCLGLGHGFPPVGQAMIFGPDFRVSHAIPLDGLPSRARVSPDGGLGATTVFVTGHSYSEDGFSTSTVILNMEDGRVLGNLETFSILKNGRTYTSPDVNFWGVTFAADSNRFLATLSTAGHTYLVEGDVAARRVVVGRENVECPSLSPDGTRVGFKKRVDDGHGTPVWRFHVLESATGREVDLAETRNIDDQLEWLDDRTVVYGSAGAANAVFAVPADGTGEPRQLLGGALSPAVLRAYGAAEPIPALPRRQEVTVGIANLRADMVAPGHATAAAPVVHSITVTNRGPEEATRVVVDDVATGPGRITAVHSDTPAGAGGYGCAVVDGQRRARCNLARLPVDASWTITVTLAPTGPGDLVGRTLVSGAESGSADRDRRVEVRTLVG